MKREVQIKLKAVSADHCQVSYDNQAGWSISEKGKDKLSSNGTFVFMKSHTQMTEHEPSDLIPLYDGMVLSFINYEIRVNLEKKDASEVSKENEVISQKNQDMEQAAASFKNTIKASNVAAMIVEPEGEQQEVEAPAQVEEEQKEEAVEGESAAVVEETPAEAVA